MPVRKVSISPDTKRTSRGISRSTYMMRMRRESKRSGICAITFAINAQRAERRSRLNKSGPICAASPLANSASMRMSCTKRSATLKICIADLGNHLVQRIRDNPCRPRALQCGNQLPLLTFFQDHLYRNPVAVGESTDSGTLFGGQECDHFLQPGFGDVHL